MRQIYIKWSMSLRCLSWLWGLYWVSGKVWPYFKGCCLLERWSAVACGVINWSKQTHHSAYDWTKLPLLLKRRECPWHTRGFQKCSTNDSVVVILIYGALAEDHLKLHQACLPVRVCTLYFLRATEVWAKTILKRDHFILFFNEILISWEIYFIGSV